MTFLYDIFIYPLVQILNLCYLFFFRIFNNHGISIISVSFTVSILTLPLFIEAEKWQQIERDIRKKLSLKIKNIKEVFKGDERFLLLSVYYKQNNYHPIYSLRSSIGLLLQIPFFIAAFSYLSNLDTLLGTPFTFLGFSIKNLGIPDSFIANKINLLPILMTIINLLASFVYIKNIYPKGSSTYGLLKENIQLIGMALIFFVLLYNSPAGLVLYWTFNNVFSLLKNFLINNKNKFKIIYFTACIFAVLLTIYLFFFHHGALFKRLIVSLVFLSVFFIPFLVKPAKYIKELFINFLNNQNIAGTKKQTVFFSCLILILLFGLVIPSSLISSSVSEFSFIEEYKTPFPFIYKTMLQSIGFFFILFIGIYFLLSDKKKCFLTYLVTGFTFCCLLNNYLFAGNYGYITIELIFSSREVLIPSFFMLLTNIFSNILIFIIIFILLFKSKKIIIHSMQIISILCLIIFSAVNILNISYSYKTAVEQRKTDNEAFLSLSGSNNNLDIITPHHSSIYNFSKTGKNVLIIMLDRGISAFIPYILSEKPQLHNSLSGFIYYPNTISFSAHTIFSAPSIFGGYDYTPYKINTRKNNGEEILLSDKHNEAFKVLPEIFINNGYNVTVTNLPLYNDSIQNVFSSYQNIKALNIMNMFAENWLSQHPEVQPISIKNILYNRLIYFSFLKSASLLFRHYIYDDGRWLAAEIGNTPVTTIESYSMLDVLPEITHISDAGNNLIMMVNNLPHEPAFLQAPDYTIPSVSSTNKGNGPFALVNNYHVTMASILLLGKWFDYLKENDVYDNTRIIIVSDHGFNDFLSIENCFALPTGESLLHYSALLLFKDFNSASSVITDNQFMTIADTSIFALKDIINNPENPFTGNRIISDKDNGVTITSSQKKSSQFNYHYNIDKKDWLHVHTSIFEPKNWNKVIFE